MTFAEIENILEFSLPESARRYQAWWANNPIDGRQSMAWLSAGRETEDLDLGGETVTFRRSDDALLSKPHTAGETAARSAQKPVIDADLNRLPDAADGSIAIEAAMQWKQLGAIALDDAGKLLFPVAPTVPGLYRMCLSNASGTRHYIGEAMNLRRRFAHYRNPGPSQQTNIRVNEVLRTHLDAGGEAMVDLIVSGISLSVGGRELSVDLDDKAVRRLLEQAAVVANAAIDIDSLNR
jgi:hypothetical protein